MNRPIESPPASQTSPSAPSSERERLPGAPRPARGAVAIACTPPDQRLGDLPAVEWKRRDQVEHEHERVDDRHPAQPHERRCGTNVGAAAGDHFGEVTPGRRQSHRQGAQDDHRERHQRTRDRHLQLRSGRARQLAHARQPTERPQVDPRYRQAVAPRHERVPELVQDHRHEERQHDRHRDQICGRLRAAENFVESRREQDHEQEQHDEPADADTDPDAEYAGELKVGARTHGYFNGRRLPGKCGWDAATAFLKTGWEVFYF